ncbi:conjugal transfer pilus assembly protein TraK [Massilia arenosa]|uniref:Conjugal transfer pilus assembly protein TraK n=2 Tax=Zemynaea arenosa TaxID=2561931 RepID=A0A4Y9RVV5_9BURK|nr:conjugal transfer pilus assembly protein TraK [Massilia arenosa]
MATISKLLLLALYLSSAQAAFAAHRLDARDGAVIESVIAARESTRIRIEGSRIVDVVGNIYANTCQSATSGATALQGASPQNTGVGTSAGEFILSCDLAKGEIYVKPVARQKKPINLFVSSPRATYTLVLRIADVPADTLVLVDKSQPREPAADARLAAASERIRTLKILMAGMATGRIPSDARIEEPNQTQNLRVGSALTLQNVVRWSGWTGERYLLTNISSSEIDLAEQEFDRDGDQIAAIALENHRLAPGASTQVYVIRRGD